MAYNIQKQLLWSQSQTWLLNLSWSLVKIKENTNCDSILNWPATAISTIFLSQQKRRQKSCLLSSYFMCKRDNICSLITKHDDTKPLSPLPTYWNKQWLFSFNSPRHSFSLVLFSFYSFISKNYTLRDKSAI